MLVAGFGGGGQSIGFEGNGFARLAWSAKGDWWGLINGEREGVKFEKDWYFYIFPNPFNFSYSVLFLLLTLP